MNAPVNLRTEAPLPVRLLVTAADDFVRERAVAEKKLQAAQREIARIERALEEVAAAIHTLGAVYEPPVEAR
jgi:hypothetical protein